MLDIPLIVTSILLLLVILLYFLNNSNRNLADKFYYWAIILYFISEVIFLFLLFFSTEEMPPQVSSLYLWKIALILKIFNSALLSIIHSYVLLNTWEKHVPAFVYCLIGGIIVALLINPPSITVSETNGRFFFAFQSLFPLFFISLFFIFLFIITIYTQISYQSNISNQKTRMIFNVFSVLFILKNVLFLIHLYFQSTITRYMISFSVLVLLVFLTYIILAHQSIFTVVTNKIYNFIIFHRSGILLFSFNFETQKETDESILKGSILIGINHILSNFTQKKDKLNLIKMKNRDIIFEYDNQYEYGLLLITKHKTQIIEKMVKIFMKRFNQLNETKLKQINQANKVIDVSDFKNTKSLITDLFSSYINVKSNSEDR